MSPSQFFAFLFSAIGGVIPWLAYIYAPTWMGFALAVSAIAWGLFGTAILGAVMRRSRTTIITNAEGKIAAIYPRRRTRQSSRGEAN